LIVQVRADVREGRLDFIARFWGAASAVSNEPTPTAAPSETRVAGEVPNGPAIAVAPASGG
ncbi:MAG TPA: hypothetical protein VMG12_23295, partial [Polyangiaceae bacterium]|nr:hypothetical protein [Polyangiaceae bacterium]